MHSYVARLIEAAAGIRNRRATVRLTRAKRFAKIRSGQATGHK
jgi:hypothetical protein